MPSIDVLGMNKAAEPIRTGHRRAAGSSGGFWNGIPRRRQVGAFARRRPLPTHAYRDLVPREGGCGENTMR